MAVTSSPAKRTHHLLPVLAGTAMALIIIFLLQQWVKGGPPENAIPYEDVIKPYSARHIRAEFWGMLIGIFIGSLVTSLLFPHPTLVRGLWIAVLVTSIIAVTPWKFALQKEIIIFALPLWMIAAIGGFYPGRVIERRRKNRQIRSSM
jgi:uncharacterized protein YacL